ncbi:MAG TPA: family 1 glycosylhydrolase, partial [Tepidisphaeraceae bacterium]|nr:family 1 glycosylhydrolase [Tepidisphaeraceae bacterium]
AAAKHEATTQRFIFCTGIENSYPIITNLRGQQMRRDGLQLSEHYTHWRHDFRLVHDLGIHFLRYGPPYYKCHAGPMQYDWSFADKTFKVLRELGIEPITDLCHFGLPDWLGGSFQNADWPMLFAEYARAFAARFPWVRLYTPVNEIFICAQFSARNGWWNEQLKSERAFVLALKHMCRATLLAEQAILQVRPNAQFIQSESSTYFHSQIPEARDKAGFFNEWRFLALDLCYGREVNGSIYEYLNDNGLSREEYHWFMTEGPKLRRHCIVGSDYYATNEKKVVNADGAIQLSGEVLGYYQIARQYFERYRLPVFHTETNRKDDADAPRWLYKEWFNILRLKADGIPVLGFTWYSLLDQTDWDVVLREDHERINPMGLYDLSRKIRAVGEAYRGLIQAWHDRIPLESLSRDLSPAKPGSTLRPKSGKRRRGDVAWLSRDGKPRPIKEHPPKPSRRKIEKAP